MNKIIANQVIKWTTEHISKDFEFRPHQLECIVNIIDNIIEHRYSNYIVEAPTGSGKSLINIISAGVLADHYKMTSYILVSDLFLWEQYENFLKKYPNTHIASIKGQTGNYKCTLNNEDMKNADCKMAGLSWAAMFNKDTIDKYGYDCAYTCKYLNARRKAIKAKACVMTYQLFLFLMNNKEFNTSNGVPIFSPHDVLFCDECHNIPDIVQTQYAPTIKLDDFDKLKILYNQSVDSAQLRLFDDRFAEDEQFYKRYPTFTKLNEKLISFWQTWTCTTSRHDEDKKAFDEYLRILEEFSLIATTIKSNITDKKQRGEPLTKDDIKLFKTCSWHENYMCHWHDYCVAIGETGSDYMLKDVNIYERGGETKISVSFKCTKEDYITYRFLLSNAPYKVMLSATIGSLDAYKERMGFKYETKSNWDHENAIVDEPCVEIIPSTFDFSESPIFFLNKFKMSYKEKDASFAKLKPVIYSICETRFANAKGMIQTGSYEFAKRLFNDAPETIKNRMLLYNGSIEKMTMTRLHKMSKNTILVGPTLNTGVDLPGDDCRFVIILKVPYPSLADKLVNARIKLYPLWYNAHTSNEIIQGIGRGVRYNGDWCVTYIFDACFQYLYYSTKAQYPQELRDRIKYI